jgi:hypothetical protein
MIFKSFHARKGKWIEVSRLAIDPAHLIEMRTPASTEAKIVSFEVADIVVVRAYVNVTGLATTVSRFRVTLDVVDDHVAG